MKAYVLFSSSSGNCAYIKDNETEFLIDAGLSAKQISDSLTKLGTSLSKIKAIFITHEHGDHIKALNVICRHYDIPVYVPPKSLDYIANHNPWTRDKLVENGDGDVVFVDNVKVTAFETPHDSLGSVCFRIETDTHRLGYATDIGHITDNVKKALNLCENVVIESNYDEYMLKNGDYPYDTKKRIAGKKGHLSNCDCANFLPELIKNGANNIVLAHISKNNNNPKIALGECRGVLSLNGISVHHEKGKGSIRLCAAMPDGIVEII